MNALGLDYGDRITVEYADDEQAQYNNYDSNSFNGE